MNALNILDRLGPDWAPRKVYLVWETLDQHDAEGLVGVVGGEDAASRVVAAYEEAGRTARAVPVDIGWFKPPYPFEPEPPPVPLPPGAAEMVEVVGQAVEKTMMAQMLMRMAAAGEDRQC